MPFIHLTEHAKQRGIRRYMFTPDKLIEMAEKAVMEGYSYNDAPNKRIGRYLKNKAGKGNKAYAYGGYIFILSPNMVLITTFRMPFRYLN